MELIKRVKRCSRFNSVSLRCLILEDHLSTVQYLGAELFFLTHIRCSAGRKRAERRMMGGEELFSLHLANNLQGSRIPSLGQRPFRLAAPGATPPCETNPYQMFGQQGKEIFNRTSRRRRANHFFRRHQIRERKQTNLSGSLLSAKHNEALHWIACSTEAPEACDDLTTLLLADGRAYCTTHDCAT